ncbi:MAG: DUF5985 family protein [Acidobacteriota bacterium]
MAGIIYALCAITALFCAVLLLQAYRRSGYRLLLWGGLCFLGLTLNNALLIVDKYVLPYVNLFPLRLIAALVAMMILLYGLIWDEE